MAVNCCVSVAYIKSIYETLTFTIELKTFVADLNEIIKRRSAVFHKYMWDRGNEIHSLAVADPGFFFKGAISKNFLSHSLNFEF